MIGLRIRFHVNAKVADFFLALPFLRGAATRQQSQGSQHEKAIEHARTTLHSFAQANGSTNQSKATMGKQYNKVEKRKRRVAYNKRKKTAAKVKKPKKAKA